jgi:hypothetical protein
MAILNTAAAAKTAMLTGLNSALGSASTVTIYSGTMPVSGDTALSGNTALATFTFGSVFGAISGSTITAIGMPMTVAVIGSGGTATFARFATSGGITICDADVGTSGATVIIGNLNLQSGTNAQLTSTTFTSN